MVKCSNQKTQTGWMDTKTVQFSHSVVSDSLWPHESQHARPPCASPTSGVHSDSCPSSQWCHPPISSSVVPFSSYHQSLPASESFPMSQLFEWGGQSTGVSALASFLPKNTQSWSPLEWPHFLESKKWAEDLNKHFSKWLEIISAGKDVEKREYFCTVDGNVNWYIDYGKHYGGS